MRLPFGGPICCIPLFDAEGATASETLRHQGPPRPATLWKAAWHIALARLTEGSN
jgi:hypothetical protein